MKNKNILPLFFLLTFVANLAKAQTEDTKKDKKDGSTVIDFGKKAETTQKDTDKKSSSLEYHNLIWVEGLCVMSGQVGIGYERAVTDRFSLSLGTGFIFPTGLDATTHQLMANLFAPDANKINENYWADKGFTDNNDDFLINYQTESNNNNNNAKYKQVLGSYYLIEPKYFPEGDVFEGFYVSSRVQYLKFNYQGTAPLEGVYSNVNTQYSNTAVALNKTYLDIIPNFGFQSSSDRRFIEVGVGVGARFYTIHAYDSGYKIGANNSDIIHESRMVDQTNLIPAIMLNGKIGFLF